MRHLAAAFILSALLGAPSMARAESVPEAARQAEENIRELENSEIKKSEISERLAENLKKNGFVEKQLLEGAAYLANKGDIFKPSTQAYSFYAINQVLLQTVWKVRHKSDEEILVKRALPISRDVSYPASMRLFYLQIANSHLRDIENQQKPLPAALRDEVLKTAHEIGTRSAPMLSAYAVRAIAEWELDAGKREAFLEEALSSNQPEVEDSAAEAGAFFGASARTRGKTLDRLKNLDGLPENRQQNILRAITRFAADPRIPLGERKRTQEQLLALFETTKNDNLRERLGRSILRIGTGLSGVEKDEFVKRLKGSSSRGNEKTKRVLDEVLDGISVEEENARRVRKTNH